MKTCAEVLAAYNKPIEVDETLVNEHIEAITEQLFEYAKYKSTYTNSNESINAIDYTINHIHTKLTQIIAEVTIEKLLDLGFYIYRQDIEYEHSNLVYRLRVSYIPNINRN